MEVLVRKRMCAGRLFQKQSVVTEDKITILVIVYMVQNFLD